MLVQPVVEKSLESMGEEDFATVLPKLASVAIESIANILKISRDSDSGLRSHDFIAGTVLAEVDAQISASHQMPTHREYLRFSSRTIEWRWNSSID